MPVTSSRDARLRYELRGEGPPVVLLPPAGTGGSIWTLHQAPALQHAGYQTVTVDFRETSPATTQSDHPVRISNLVTDVAELIGTLEIAPCRVIGASLGAMVTQELALAHPDLVISTALLGTRCRTDFTRAAWARASAAHLRTENGAPRSDYDAIASLMQLFSSRTLSDEKAMEEWITLFRSLPVRSPGSAEQYEASIIPDRTAALRSMTRPSLVIGFDSDLLTPPDLCKEVAEAIPRSRYTEVAGCGHFGFLEEPEVVNSELIKFFAEN
ncbi:alpha/beta hydrolase [Streptomyces vastus]|uniref:Alpha/beta hydrolase n=1 Tax=Streptomyces vastus TaxID=285451 RepID=A0ABN3QCY2_9ACTN